MCVSSDGMEALHRVDPESDFCRRESRVRGLSSPWSGAARVMSPHGLFSGKWVKRVKCVGTVLLFTLLLCLSLPPWSAPLAAAEEEGESDIGFVWAFSAMVGEGNEARMESVRTGMELKTGDQFKMLVELRKKCFVYVVYHNSQDELSMLFPYSLEQYKEGYELQKKYYIPQGDAWFELDSHAGQETFYLLASTDRLSELEHLFNWYISADDVKKPDITRQILAEIRNIKTDHQDLASAAERPVPIGGAIRGIERAQGANRADIDTLSEEISATDFYAKTFTIEHR